MQENTINQNKNSNYPEEEEFSFKKLFQKWIDDIVYALRFWPKLFVAGSIGALIFLIAAWMRPITYTARLTFVVEESKTGGGSLASALSGQFGFDIGSLTGSNGVLAGDNVLELLKSHSLIKKTLLSAYNDSGSYSLADQYASIYGWKEKWKNSSKVGREINFSTNQQQFSRLEDSLLHLITKQIAEEELSISKPDKKLGFFEIQITTRDEKFSQLFSERILKFATDFYVETKTRRLRGNVDRLERRADSLGLLLNRKTYSAADANLMLLDGNPAYASPSVSAEISSRDKAMQGIIYSEIVKNLEISKTALIQETPTVQVVDSPEMPLKKNKFSKLMAIVLGFGIASVLTGLFIISKRKNHGI
ncbi:MAG: hypothetical protein KGL19_01985 [Bacteroidota bacterium]|nr:hypothetical protein [Bacteroidota bacterium]